MPSVFVLEGPKPGAIAVPTERRPTFHYGLTTHRPTSLVGNLGAAVATGFGEITSGVKTGLLALGTLAVVGLVFAHGNTTARRRGRALFGARRRRRRR